MICTVKPEEVCVYVPKVGVSATFKAAVDAVLLVPLLYPLRVVVIVATEVAPGANPVIVAIPLPEIETVPPLVAEPAHV